MRVIATARRRAAALVLCLAACLTPQACTSDQSAPGKEPAPAAAPSRQASAVLEGKIAFLEGVLNRRPTAARLLGDLTVALPGRVWPTEVAYDGRAVRVKGRAPSNDLVADYVSGLGRSAVLADVSLVSSTQWGTRNTGYVEFEVQASVREDRAENAREPGPGRNSESSDALSRRLEELEKVIAAPTGTAGALRDLQNAANDARLAVTTFAPGAEAPGELYNEWPVSIVVAGSREALGRYLERIGVLPRPWLVDRFSFRAESEGEPRSPVSASIMLRTYLPRGTSPARGR